MAPAVGGEASHPQPDTVASALGPTCAGSEPPRGAGGQGALPAHSPSEQAASHVPTAAREKAARPTGPCCFTTPSPPRCEHTGRQTDGTVGVGAPRGPRTAFSSFPFFFSRSFSLCFFSFFLGFLIFFSGTGTSSFSGDLEVSEFLCFWTGSFSLSARGLGRQVTE